MIQDLLQRVKEAIFDDPTTPHRSDYDPSGLIGKIESLFGGAPDPQPGFGNVRPASEDPLGDPADAYGAAGHLPPNVRPASEDPLGDPGISPGPAYGDREGRQIRPASEDPLGDPADQEPPRR